MNTINAIAVAISFVFSAGAMAQSMSKDQYKAAKTGTAAEYKSARAACGSLAGNRKGHMQGGGLGQGEGREGRTRSEIQTFRGRQLQGARGQGGGRILGGQGEMR